MTAQEPSREQRLAEIWERWSGEWKSGADMADITFLLADIARLEAALREFYTDAEPYLQVAAARSHPAKKPHEILETAKAALNGEK